MCQHIETRVAQVRTVMCGLHWRNTKDVHTLFFGVLIRIKSAMVKRQGPLLISLSPYVIDPCSSPV